MDWKYGDRMIVAPPVPTEEAKTKYEDFQIKELPSGKESARCKYMGSTWEHRAGSAVWICCGGRRPRMLCSAVMIPCAQVPAVREVPRSQEVSGSAIVFRSPTCTRVFALQMRWPLVCCLVR